MKSKGKRILLGIVLTLAVVIFLLAAAVWGIWGNELRTLASFQLLREANFDHLDGEVYYMDVKGGYYLEDFIARGGCSTDAELVSFITDHITKGLIPMKVEVDNIGCASFTAKTEAGEWLFGRNFDVSSSNLCLVRTNPGGGRHESISTVDVRFLGIPYEKGVKSLMDKVTCLAAPYAPVDGINDAGVACGIYMTFQEGGANQNTDRPDITSSTLVRMILDYAGNLDEAIAIAQSYDLHDSANAAYHYMVADASGRSAILEWVADDRETDNDTSARKLVVICSDDDAYIGEREGKSDFQWITNFLIVPGYYGEGDKMVGLDRYDAIYDMLAPTNGILADEDAGMDILAAVGRRTWDKNNPDGLNHTSVHSVIYNLTNRTVYWVSNENYDDPSAIFRLNFER